jgi:RimJ/RimL family protein N-acetyltransferase
MKSADDPRHRGADVRLEPFGEEDFSRLLRWIDSRELLIQWAGPLLFHYPLDRSQLQCYLQNSTGMEPRSMIFRAVDGAQAAVGHIELGAINRENGTASVCRVFVDPAHRGKGIARSMVHALLAISFRKLDLHRIELKVYSFNLPAIRCYEAAGFLKEGMLRESVRVADRYWDTVLMGILRDEWERGVKSPKGSDT